MSDIKPKRGRPSKYTNDEKEEKYKERQRIQHKLKYNEDREIKIEKTKLQQSKYRESFKLLKEMWNNNDIKTTKYDEILKNILGESFLRDNTA